MPTIDLASYVENIDDDQPIRKKLKLRAVNYDDFKPGSIIKMKLQNFVTYSYTEFQLSPSLNMIIGPNGSGKSTFVCAVCLGLAGKPEYIGRSKQVEDFIKNGCDSSTIEIYLKDDNQLDLEFMGSGSHRIRSGSNYDGLLKITRTLEKRVKIGNTTEKRKRQEYMVNDVAVSETNVRNLINKFNIQLDNLCQFLSQERVEEFAKLKPEKLLDETIRSIDFSLLELLEDLKQLQVSEIDITKEIQSNTENLRKLKNEEQTYQEEVKLINEYQKTLDDLEIHRKLLPYLKIQDHREKLKVYKQRVEQARRLYQKFQVERRPYNELSAAVESKETDFQEQIRNLENERAKKARKIQVANSDLNAMREDVEKRKLQIDYYASRSEKLREKIHLKSEEIGHIKAQINSLEAPDPELIKELDQSRTKLIENESVLNSEIDDIDTQLSSLNHNSNLIQRKISEKKQSMNSTDNIHLLDYLNDKELKKAVLYLRSEADAKNSVLEPPVLTISAIHKDFAPYIAQCIDYNTSKAFTLLNDTAYNTYGRELLKRFTANTRQLTRRVNRPPMSKEELRKLGFEGYLSDFIKGDKNVIQMLCEFQGIDQIPVSRKRFTAQQLDKLTTTASGKQPIFRKIIHGNSMLNIRYSSASNQLYSVEVIIKPTNLYQGYIISPDEKLRIQNDIKDYSNQLENIRNDMNKISDKKAQLKLKLNEVATEMSDVNKRNQYMNNLKKQKSRLEESLRLETDRIEELKRDIKKDTAPKIQQVRNKLSQTLLKEIESTQKLSRLSKELQSSQSALLRIKMAYFDHMNKKSILRDIVQSFEDKKQELRNNYDELKNSYKSLRDTEEYKQWRSEIDKYDKDTKDGLNDVAERYKEKGNFNLDFIEGLVGRLESKIQLSNHDSSAVALLEQVKNQIKELEGSLPSQNNKCTAIRKEISDKQKILEPRLEDIIRGIGKKFSDLFKDVGTAGGVALNKKSKLFSDWKLEIMVQFRDEGKLTGLDSHTQSGGERAVSTVLYMIALQKFTQAPFRVVDEINQGMDTNFERLVHKAMVQNACEEGTSQYFLITPKLLTDLNYHEKMRIHCVMAGSYLPNPLEDHNIVHLGEVSNYDI
ncbi:Structural maintenance of chromosomes protein 5 [Nakaseomyces bracarensis]|uniref:Structural maintenance of chromosomes protein 5 n=1 Tax=Nakaseomyces bracarensis TaxID=273131 RepID=A0ABR4NZ91_9SACH